MAASANACGSGQDSANANGATSNGCSVPHDSSAVGATQAALRHNPGLSAEWSSEEQSLLDELLTKYASDRNITRYAKIAMQLKDKTVRDVALRCRWMTKKENGKRRKEDHSKKSKEKKEKVTDPPAKSTPHTANRTNGSPYTQSMIPMDTDDGISYKDIGGVTGQLLEHNIQALEQISSNFASLKIHENINLFCQARNNILTVLNDISDMPEIMKHMPPLPVKLNDELANSILPRQQQQKTS
ncbi:uncharacterized protein LOC124916786 [Impatiens glandulifera]|uniref:uncharacterized protein LOC124916786 n=1 Tax=Impatiens glandulifera TaxID=253017 RepID=UPI001FB13971|nr:uncharacterized protein LOC124916786 [Impatiens glandulifera]